jgi:hypothetical protein
MPAEESDHRPTRSARNSLIIFEDHKLNVPTNLRCRHLDILVSREMVSVSKRRVLWELQLRNFRAGWCDQRGTQP